MALRQKNVIEYRGLESCTEEEGGEFKFVCLAEPAPSSEWVDEFENVIGARVFCPPIDVDVDEERKSAKMTFQCSERSAERSLVALRKAIKITNDHLNQDDERDVTPKMDDSDNSDKSADLLKKLKRMKY